MSSRNGRFVLEGKQSNIRYTRYDNGAYSIEIDGNKDRRYQGNTLLSWQHLTDQVTNADYQITCTEKGPCAINRGGDLFRTEITDRYAMQTIGDALMNGKASYAAEIIALLMK